MNLFTPIPMVYWLATPYRPDRQAHMNALLAQYEVTNEMLLGLKPDEAEGFKTRGLRGNYESHLNAVKKAKADNHNLVLVLEDDVVFKNIPMLRAVVREMFQNPVWDMFYFYPGKMKVGGRDLQRIFQAKAVNYGHAQVIRKEIYNLVIDTLSKHYEIVRTGGGDPRHSDVTNVYQEFVHPQINVYCAKEHLISQDQAAFGSDTLTE